MECGDDDPLDVVEFGDGPLAMGSVTPVKVLGSLELIDEGETDYKILTIRADDKDAGRIHDIASLEAVKPSTVAKLVDWLKKYKTAEGKGLNVLASDTPAGLEQSLAIIGECNEKWSALVKGAVPNAKGHYVSAKHAPNGVEPTALPPASFFQAAYISGGSSGASMYGSAAAPMAYGSPYAPVTAPATVASPPSYYTYPSSAAATAAAATTSSSSYTPPSYPSSSSSSSSFYSPSTSSSSLSSSTGGSFASCTAMCRELSPDVTQTCVASCVEKYGRRRRRSLLRSVA